MSLRKQRNKKSHKGKHHDQCKEEKEIESDEPCEKELTELLEKFQSSVTVDNSAEIDPLCTTQVFSYIEQDIERSGSHQSVDESACNHNIEKIVAHGTYQSDKIDGQPQQLNKINVTNFESGEAAQATYSIQPFAEAFGFIRQKTMLPHQLIDGGQASDHPIAEATCCKELLEQQHGCDCKCGVNSLGPQLAANSVAKAETSTCVIKPAPRSNTRRKEDKNVDSVLKMLKPYGSIEEKLEALVRKYSDISEENRRNQLTSKQMEKQILALQREKDILQADHSKAVLTRSRLENLCRELQRQNKSIKDESILKIREEEEKRKEMSNKFQTTLTEVTALIEQNKEENLRLIKENCEIVERFENVHKQYEQRDQQLEKLSKQMQLEMQLSEARMAKSRMEMAAEKEKLLQEKHTLLLEVSKLQGKLKEMAENERQLRSQVSLYTDKYSDFQSALTKSNDVFANFKAEMDKMTKKIVKLEKEISIWRQRWEVTHDKLAEALVERQKFSVEAFSSTRKAMRLQTLCRALQDDRATLIKKLRAAEASETTQEEKNDMKDYIKNVSKELDNEVLEVFNSEFVEEIEADNTARDISNSGIQIEIDNIQEVDVNNIQNACDEPEDTSTQSLPNSPVPNDLEHGTIEEKQPPMAANEHKKKKSNKKKSK